MKIFISIRLILLNILFVILIFSCDAFIIDSEGPESILSEPEGDVNIDSVDNFKETGYINYGIHNTGGIDFVTTTFNITVQIDITPLDTGDSNWRYINSTVIAANPIVAGATYYSKVEIILQEISTDVYEKINNVTIDTGSIEFIT